MDVEEKFHKACDHLPSLVKKLDSAILLRFYGLYKQASIGPCNIDKPSWYQMEAKSKYNAWNGLGEMTKPDAMAKYIELLGEVSPGWEEKEEEEIDWDGECQSEGKESQTKGWVNVSSMVNESGEENLKDHEKSVFDWAKEGSVSGLKNMISCMENFDVNARDENGLNCLHWACDRGHLDVVKYLIEQCEADVHCEDSDGELAIEYASAIEHNELVDYLRGAGSK